MFSKIFKAWLAIVVAMIGVTLWFYRNAQEVDRMYGLKTDARSFAKWQHSRDLTVISMGVLFGVILIGAITILLVVFSAGDEEADDLDEDPDPDTPMEETPGANEVRAA